MARTETFIAKGSRIVIRQPKGNAQWYVTKKDVVVDAAKIVEALCPMTGNPVGQWVESGISLFFPARIIRVRLVLEDGDLNPAVLDEQFSLFHYDVPARGEFPNPSARLYPIAVRLTESCWIVKTGDVPYHLMGEMLDAGCKVRVNKFDKSESRALLVEAIDNLRQQIVDKVQSANASCEAASAQLDASDAEGLTEVAARKRYENRIKTIERSLNVLTSDLTKAAEKFGINRVAINLTHLSTIATEVRKSSNAKASAYVHGAMHLGQVGTVDATALATAATTSAVPAYVMADVLREAGNEEAANALQTAFDDNEYSLVDNSEDVNK